MRGVVVFVCLCAIVEHVSCYRYHNETLPDAASQQLTEFRNLHPNPIGVTTKVSGEPLDIRDFTTMNTDIFISRNHFRLTSHFVRERIPERIVHAKGIGAFGYFEVTHDVSKYIKSDVFNGIGKKTPVVARYSSVVQNLGGSDLVPETKAMALKFYTQEGNLDLICLHLPIFLYRDPIIFQKFTHAFKRNPRTDLIDNTARWDLLTLHPDPLHTVLWLASDFGLPDGYRKMDAFAEHVYEVYNKHGDRYYVKFNFRTEQGLFNLTTAQAQAIGVNDPDYFNRDLYNAIAAKQYPTWRLEMDILTMDDLLKVDYDPFDMTRLWKRGTYHTVTVGRLVINQRAENNFRDIDQSAFCPSNLVPGIKGPLDLVFRARKIFYPDTQNYRLGVNHDNIRVNAPLYDKTYSRDGKPPVADNMKDAPNYFPNSFNGPMPYVDEARSSEDITVYHRNAFDLQPMAEFYNEIVDSDAHRQRVANGLANSLRTVPRDLEKKAMRILTLISRDLGRRVRVTLAALRAEDVAERRSRIAQCLDDVNRRNAERFDKYIKSYSNMHT
ncbi:catalase-like [Anticarsia gemmatalis]|uniref:catalase-like n=1 Tax=Anticarsia gemmatalis TaxID=129554 RepID=UPI003F76A13D